MIIRFSTFVALLFCAGSVGAQSEDPPVAGGHPLDYAYTYWPGNHWYVWNQYQSTRHFRTGRYGMALDVTNFSITALGILQDNATEEQALTEPVDSVTQCPEASVSYGLTIGSDSGLADGFACENENTNNPSRLIDMGRAMQVIDVPQVTYSALPDATGTVKMAAGMRHFVLTHQAVTNTSNTTATVSLTLSGEAVDLFPFTELLLDGRAIRVHDATNLGWTFVVADAENATVNIQQEINGSIRFELTRFVTDPSEEISMSVTAVPSNAGTADQQSVWLDPGNVAQLSYDQMNRDGSGGNTLENAVWDHERGAFVVQLANLSEVGAPGWQNWSDLNIHNWYNRHRVQLVNNSTEAIMIPVVFEGGNNAAFYIVGGSPMLRDTNGNPLGIPVQISKNWHEQPFWYHLHTGIPAQPGTHEIEHTFAHAKWGTAFASAHSQLSLVGWGRNQQWDESSLGAFGESITYDPDMTLGRAMVDDVRPFLVDANGQWNWTGNVGGANFLVYGTNTTDAFPEHQLGRIKTRYRATGPNLTDVIYSGITRDGKVQARIATQLGRTDDLVRAYYHLEYTFLEDVEYQRLAFFQVAADRYGDNGFTRHAYGNASGVLFDESIADHGTTGYASAADRGIELPGQNPWVMLYDNVRSDGNLPENLADIGFVVRDYQATIGSTVIDTPHINIRRTFNGGWSQMAFELGLPYEPSNRIIPAGSQVRATVEYLVPPADKLAYYGPSDYLNALSATKYRSTDMMMELANGNALTVDVRVGSLSRNQPVELVAASGSTAAEFDLTGGRGYVPITIHGLASYEGWTLELIQDGQWTSLNQEVEGNDYWQAVENSMDGTYSLTWNVPNRDTGTYRVHNPDATTCAADLNGDDTVNFSDLQVLLSAWGPSSGGDTNNDGVTDFGDLLIVINDWGGCP